MYNDFQVHIFWCLNPWLCSEVSFFQSLLIRAVDLVLGRSLKVFITYKIFSTALLYSLYMSKYLANFGLHEIYYLTAKFSLPLLS